MRTILMTALLTLAGGLLFGAPPGASDGTARLPEFGPFLDRQKGLSSDAFCARYASRSAGPDDARLNLDGVQYLDLIERRLKPKPAPQPLSDAEKRTLSAQRLVVLQSREFPSFGHAFYDIFANDQPLFVGSDPILHAFHKNYDRLLLDLETHYLSPLLAGILQGGADGLRQLRGSLGQDAVVAQAADDLEFLFGVARELLKGSNIHESPRINRVLRAVADETPLEIPFLGVRREVDFSQFRPRGHYTKTEELKRYFRAMMWLGREDLSFHIGERFRETVAAFLLSAALLQGSVYSSWEEFDRLMSFLIGSSDGANPRDLLALLRKLGYRDFAEFVRKASPAETLARIGEAKIGEQKILSSICRKDPAAPMVALPKTAQLMGQRFTLDAFLFHQLSYDRIPGNRLRMLPQPLDIPAAMGQARAIELLKPEVARFGHQESLAACIEFLKIVPESFWKENVYHGWLDVLRDVGREPDPRAPALFRTRAWADLKLQTQLASWAQLRHDTILYAKQSYSFGATCEYCDVYVEPNPTFFTKLQNLCEGTASVLRAPPLASKEAKSVMDTYNHRFTLFAKTMSQLAAVAEKELKGTPITAEEHQFLRQAVEAKRSGGCAGPGYFLSGWYPMLFANQKECLDWDPTIADVHTQPTDGNGNDVGNVLHVGVGNVNLAAFVVTGHDGKERAFLGPVFSYYELIQGDYRRLTDEAWKERLGCPTASLSLESLPIKAKGPAPVRPAWLRELFAR